jgi:hypothetical protein
VVGSHTLLQKNTERYWRTVRACSMSHSSLRKDTSVLMGNNITIQKSDFVPQKIPGLPFSIHHIQREFLCNKFHKCVSNDLWRFSQNYIRLQRSYATL